MVEPKRRLHLRSSGRTDTGQVRSNNEDSIHLWTQDTAHVLAVVADGMGGAVAGEEASHIAIETIRQSLASSLTFTPEGDPIRRDAALDEAFKASIYQANLNILQKANTNPDLKGMGTTLTLAYIYEGNVVVGNVGDSRAYLVNGRSHRIQQITSDHSFVQALLSAGHISEQEAEDHPMRNVLYRALGQSASLDIDIYYEQLQTEDRLVLCSDGLTLHVKQREIADIAMTYDNPEAISQTLVDLANSRGGEDNISVIVIKVEEAPLSPETNHQMRQEDQLSSQDGHSDTTVPGENANLGAADSSSTLNHTKQTTTSANRDKEATHSSGQSEALPPALGEGQDIPCHDQ